MGTTPVLYPYEFTAQLKKTGTGGLKHPLQSIIK
jgi:hypothetical protein